MAKLVLGKSVRSDWFLLGRDFAVRAVPWKRSKPCIFVLEQSRAIQNLQPKQRKNLWILSFFTSKLPEKVKKIEILPRFQRLMKMTNILRTSFIILKIWKLLVQKLKQASPKARRPWTILSTNRKVQTQTRRRLLTWTLLSATWKLMVRKMRKLKAYVGPSLTTFCRIFFWRHAGKTEKNTSQQQFSVFSTVYSDTWVRRNIHSTCSRTMGSKNTEKSLKRRESHLCSRARRGSKPQAAQAIDEDEEDALFEAGEFGESNPAALWWVLSLHFGFRARENISQAIRYCLPPLQF